MKTVEADASRVLLGLAAFGRDHVREGSFPGALSRGQGPTCISILDPTWQMLRMGCSRASGVKYWHSIIAVFERLLGDAVGP